MRLLFGDNPQWHRGLCLPLEFNQNSWGSFLHWNACHKAKVQHVYAFSQQGTTALTGPAQESVHPAARSSTPLCGQGCLLSAFTSLRSCCLDVSGFPSHDTALDLGLLQGLRHLDHLRVDNEESIAYCCHLNALQHLTKLEVCKTDVRASANCPFVDSLMSLKVQCGGLRGMHSNGVAACQHLRHLHCSYSVISAQADMDSLVTDHTATLIPNGMSALVLLAELDLKVAESAFLVPEDQLDLSWLTVFTNLTKLSLSIDYAYSVPSDITKLAKLTQLSLQVESESAFRLDVDWQAFTCLRVLRVVAIGGGGCHLSHELLKLVAIRALIFVQICLSVRNVETDAHLVALEQAIRKSAPWIKLHVGQQVLSEFAILLEAANGIFG